MQLEYKMKLRDALIARLRNTAVFETLTEKGGKLLSRKILNLESGWAGDSWILSAQSADGKTFQRIIINGTSPQTLEITHAPGEDLEEMLDLYQKMRGPIVPKEL